MNHAVKAQSTKAMATYYCSKATMRQTLAFLVTGRLVALLNRAKAFEMRWSVNSSRSSDVSRAMVGEELFCWERRGVDPTQNHVFPVHCLVDDQALVLGEGQAMRWLCFEDLKTIQLIPGLRERLSRIEGFLVSTLGHRSNC